MRANICINADRLITMATIELVFIFKERNVSRIRDILFQPLTTVLTFLGNCQDLFPAIRTNFSFFHLANYQVPLTAG